MSYIIHQLQFALQCMLALTNHTSVVVFFIGLDGVYHMCQGKPLRLLKPELPSVVGRHIADVLHGERDVLKYAEIALGGTAFDTVVELRGRVFHTFYEPIRDSHGTLQGTLGIANDITERVALEAELAQVRERIASQASAMLQLVHPGADVTQAVLPTPFSPDRAVSAACPALAASGIDLLQTLTEREGEVLRLVAEGQTNQQIAQTLHISPKTVAKHLSSVYAKLHVASRTEAALLAVREGI